LKCSVARIKKRKERALIEDDDEIQRFLDIGYELKIYNKTMPS